MNLQDGPNGLKKVVVDEPEAAGEIYLHGAHITHFQPRGQKPVLFLSRESLFQPGKAIRGGVPICFPWFGPKANDPAAPMHGFARVSEWKLDSVERGGDSTLVILSMQSSDRTRVAWPHEFSAYFEARIGRNLEVRLRITNRGETPAPFQEALHTYLHVGDVRRVSLRGLENTRYLDKVGNSERVEGEQAMQFLGETDRVYLDTQTTCVIDDPVLKRKISIEKSGSRATVVWNPWIDKAKALPDFGDDEWPGMLCVETANTADCAITLQPGQSHTIGAIVRVE